MTVRELRKIIQEQQNLCDSVVIDYVNDEDENIAILTFYRDKQYQVFFRISDNITLAEFNRLANKFETILNEYGAFHNTIKIDNNLKAWC